MIEFLWGLAGAVVAVVVVGFVLNRVLAAMVAPSTIEPSLSDKAIGFVVGVAVIVALTWVTRGFVADAGPFVDQLSLGAGLAVVLDGPPLVAFARGHGRAPGTSPQPEPQEPQVTAVPFSEAVHQHFAEPIVRARYVVAAYRRGLIPPGAVPGLAADLAPMLSAVPAWTDLAEVRGDDGLADAVDRAALAIGYAPTEDQARADVVERLLYVALCSGEPRVRVETAELLGLPIATDVESSSWPEWLRGERASELRVRFGDAFALRYGPTVGDGVHRRFASPAARARELIAEYRGEVITSDRLPYAAAEIVADLPEAGEAWAELAMAPPGSVRSDLLPVLDRAADEIDYTRTDSEIEVDLLEAAAYRAVTEGSVVRESNFLRRFEFWDEHAPELESLRNAWHMLDGAEEQLAGVRGRLIEYLAARYPG